MAEILSQSQIDSLLSSLISGKDEPETPWPVKRLKIMTLEDPNFYQRTT